MEKNIYTEQELNAAYNSGIRNASPFWLLVGISIGFIVGCGLTYIKFTQTFKP